MTTPIEQQIVFFKQFQKSCEDGNSDNVLYLPPTYRNNGEPKVSMWCIKPVIICVPHLQFGMNIPCPNPNCGNNLSSMVGMITLISLDTLTI
jgi:hypothetical protein